MPTTQGARRTRERVLSAALGLFNERGSAAVTTNHVAARAGISPGNLYYWFRDKDEIIRELYAQFVAAYDLLWGAGQGGHGGPDGQGGLGSLGGPDGRGGPDGQSGLDGSGELTPEQVLARLAEATALSRRYAFLARDLLGLIHADAVFAAEYRAVRERRVAAFTVLAHSWRTQGTIRALDDQSVADLVQALWVIAETWLAFGELDGNHADAQDGTRLLRVVLQPYLTPAGASTGQAGGPRGLLQA